MDEKTYGKWKKLMLCMAAMVLVVGILEVVSELVWRR